jgi:hypothetical protein
VHDYILPPELIRNKVNPMKTFECVFKPTCRSDMEEHGPLSFTITGRSDNAVRAEARGELRKHLRETEHVLASTSYWFMSAMCEVIDE